MFQRTLLIIIKSLFTITFYVLDYISNEVHFGTLNVISDSPTSLYRNKSIFWFMQNYASKHATEFKWIYLEANKGMYGQTLLSFSKAALWN